MTLRPPRPRFKIIVKGKVQDAALAAKERGLTFFFDEYEERYDHTVGYSRGPEEKLLDWLMEPAKPPHPPGTLLFYTERSDQPD